MPLLTQWGETLDRLHPLPEYPRPQMKRASYLNLNGPWDYAITESDDLHASFDGEIIVPFSPESPLSGANRTLLSLCRNISSPTADGSCCISARSIRRRTCM